MLGIDYSFARPGAASIKSAGYQFVCRYLASSAGKAITPAEATDLRNNGLALVLVFEDYANQALNGNAQGVKDAQEALQQANALGWPSNRPIYFAIDFDEADTPLQNGDIYAYLDGAASVIGRGRVGVYGGYYVVKRCLDNGKATWAWQTLAWSGGQVDSRTHIYQNGQSAFGGGADVNQALKTDFGQWAEGIGEKDIMDENDGIEFYRFGLHREPSKEEANLRDGQKFSDAANPARSSAEWQQQDHAIKDYGNQVGQVAALTNQLTTAKEAQANAEKAASDAKAAQADAEAKLATLQGQAATDTTAGDSFLRRLGQFISKYLPGGK